MDDEKLIEMVRKYEFIYNLKHPKYMDNVKKDVAWKEIGEQLKQSAVACKQRWQCLRDAYRRAFNKKKLKTGQAAKNMKQWKYENEMAFVIPFFTERKSQNSVEIKSDDELSENTYENHEIESKALENSNTDHNIDDTADDSDASSTRISYKATKYESQQKKNTNQRKAVKRKADKSEISETTMSMAKHEPPRGHDELDRFFLNISDTVKKFSPYDQALAKNKIFALVSEMELQQLAPTSSSYAFKSSPQSSSRY